MLKTKLLISFEENNKRIQNPERAECYKSLRIEQDLPLINISHPHLLELDVSTLSASKAAEKILEHVNDITREYKKEL